MDYIVYRKLGRGDVAVKQGWSWIGFLFPFWVTVIERKLSFAVLIGVLIIAGGVLGAGIFSPASLDVYDIWLSDRWGYIYVGITRGMLYVLFGKIYSLFGAAAWGWGGVVMLGIGELFAGVLVGIWGYRWHNDILMWRGWECLGSIEAPNAPAAKRWVAEGIGEEDVVDAYNVAD